MDMDRILAYAFQISPSNPKPSVEFLIRLLDTIAEIERDGTHRWCWICREAHVWAPMKDDSGIEPGEYRGYA